jgi:hypothetical protein
MIPSSRTSRSSSASSTGPTKRSLPLHNLLVSATPQAAPAEAAATAEATVTLPATLVASMTNSLNAFATHLDRLHGSHGQTLTQGTHPLPPPPPENPLVHTIRGRWPAVDPAHLQEILENRFKVENLMKLNASFVYTPDRRLENITLGSFEIPTTSRNVQINEYQEITQLLKPLAVYADILREFAPPPPRTSAIASAPPCLSTCITSWTSTNAVLGTPSGSTTFPSTGRGF